MKGKPSASTFLRDVKKHRLTVLRDDGVYRHIRLADPEMGLMGSFDILTWPDHLCFCGDMGSWLFKRHHDMFEFFRKRDKREEPNLEYFAEKLHACDKGEGLRKFDVDVARTNLVQGLRDHGLKKAEIDEYLDVLRIYSDDGDQVALHQLLRHGLQHLDGWYEWLDLTTWTTRFVWACRAIGWAIERYDERGEPCAS